VFLYSDTCGREPRGRAVAGGGAFRFCLVGLALAIQILASLLEYPFEV
jgi:hypothetical protein